MRFIGTKAHGVLDYLMGIVLIASPWLFQFYRGEAESWVPIALGIVILLYSLFTDYELGVVRGISMRAHLNLDLLGGLVLATSPWLFGFADYVYLPHLLLGIAEMGAALTTRKVPYEHPHKPVSV